MLARARRWALLVLLAVPAAAGSHSLSVPLAVRSPRAAAHSSTGFVYKERKGALPAAVHFSPSEKRFERYAAALAATEPLREKRDARAKRCMLPLQFWLLKKRGKLAGGKGVCDLVRVDPKGRNTRLRAVCGDHVKTMSAVIKALGMTVSEFNGLSREVSADPDLRSRVMEQAYFFRVAAQLQHSDAAATGLEVDDTGDILLGPGAGGVGGGAPPPPAGSPPPAASQQRRQANAKAGRLTVAEFGRASRAVESLRHQLEADLKSELKIAALPQGICGPTFLPMLAPRVRALCASFPAKATAVVEAQGVETGAFNRMLARSKRSPLLRWRLARLDRAQGPAAKKAKRA